MLKEFEFFIKDDAPGMWEISKVKEEAGAILVNNSVGLFRELGNRTEAGDHVTILFSGGVVEDCLWHSTQELLEGSSRLTGIEVDRVTVDMKTSVAFVEGIIPLTVQERRDMFINLLDDRFSQDPRLHVLPEGE
jgi:hypothetical protein